MRKVALVIALLTSIVICAQVGVGTTNPDASAALDITATDRGVLVPRVNLIDVTDATNPVNAPATGLLVWNTNIGVTGGNGVGFYFYNGVQWMPIKEAQVDDADFYEVGSTSAPDDINDNMYTLGNIGIGQTAANSKLDITENEALRVLDIRLNGDVEGDRVAINNRITGTQSSVSGSRITGIRNAISAGGGLFTYGVNNTITGDYASTKKGVVNSITGGSGTHYGVQNILGGAEASSNRRIATLNQINYSAAGSIESGVWNIIRGSSPTRKYGVWNAITHTSDAAAFGTYSVISSAGDGAHHGTSNYLDGAGSGPKYGSRNFISTTAGGTHYGVYSRVLKPGSFSGYFLGDVFIGTTTANGYIMPDSDGSNGQIMQTDGAGNVDWVDKDNNSFSLVRANLTANQGPLATTGWQKLNFEVTAFDTNTEYDTANSRFVVGNTGYYTLNAGFQTNSQGNTELYGIAVYINGALYQEFTSNHYGTGSVTKSINCMANLDAGDIVEIYIHNVQGANGTNGNNGVVIDGSNSRTYFEIQRIR
jgi:hypothetical protein